jgi:lipid-A-disaccharide synthase
MRAAGCRLIYDTTRKAAMGVGAVKRIAEMYRLVQWTKAHFQRRKVDLQICVDSPAMNFHFARAAKERGIPVLYFIAPQLWAWREGRMKKLQQWVDQVACILPFEEPYFQSHGVNARFVGHPLFDELPKNRVVEAAAKFPHRAPIVGLLPGSRKGEALANFPHLLDVARRLNHEIPEISFRVPTTMQTHPVVSEMITRHSLGRFRLNANKILTVQDAFDRLVPECDLCLTVSGTATLHVASYGVPMIVVYRGNPILWNIVGRWLVKTRTFSLVNLLSEDKRLVPEYVPWYGSNRPVFLHALDYLKNPEMLAKQRHRLLDLVDHLDKEGASACTARMALSLMKPNVEK